MSVLSINAMAYMHDRIPAANVMLQTHLSFGTILVILVVYSQVGIYSRNPRVLERRRKGSQPPLRLPLIRIFAPKVRVDVASLVVCEHRSTLWNDHLVDDGAIETTYWSMKWNHRILRCPNFDVSHALWESGKSPTCDQTK